MIAGELGVSERTIWSWLNGVTEPPVRKLTQIALMWSVSVDWLVGISDQGGPD